MKHLLSLAFASFLICQTSGRANNWGGGDLIGNGGGCAELILRISFNRINHNANAYLPEARPIETGPLKALIKSNPAEDMETRLIFSESKFEACRKMGGFVQGGMCVAPSAHDNNFYFSPAKLYSEQGVSLVTKENAVALITEAMLRKHGVDEPLRGQIRDQLQKISLKSWIEFRHPGEQHPHLSVIYTKDTGSRSQEMILSDRDKHYRVSDLIKDRDPCKVVGSVLESFALSDPQWHGITLTSRGSFRCRSGRVLRGVVSFRMGPQAIELRYFGLD